MSGTIRSCIKGLHAARQKHNTSDGPPQLLTAVDSATLDEFIANASSQKPTEVDPESLIDEIARRFQIERSQQLLATLNGTINKQSTCEANVILSDMDLPGKTNATTMSGLNSCPIAKVDANDKIAPTGPLLDFPSSLDGGAVKRKVKSEEVIKCEDFSARKQRKLSDGYISNVVSKIPVNETIPNSVLGSNVEVICLDDSSDDDEMVPQPVHVDAKATSIIKSDIDSINIVSRNDEDTKALCKEEAYLSDAVPVGTKSATFGRASALDSKLLDQGAQQKLKSGSTSIKNFFPPRNQPQCANDVDARDILPLQQCAAPDNVPS